MSEDLQPFLRAATIGEVYGWGNGANYQLGSGAVGLQEQPVRLDSLHGISVKTVAAAKFHSAAITQKGQLFTWGFGRGGRLGKAFSMQAIWAQSLFLLHSCSELAYIRTSASSMCCASCVQNLSKPRDFPRSFLLSRTFKDV